ncbi:MAG: HEAT repeat domain-containing protein [Chitinophagaceae bacterium]
MFTSHPFLLEMVHSYQLLKGMYFLLLVIAALILFIAIYLMKRKGRSAKRRQLRAAFSDFISELAVSEDEAEREQCFQQPALQALLASWLADRFARQTLIRELAATVRNMSGQAAANICWFYEKTGLHQDTLMQLKSGQWHLKARAIQQLAHLQQQRYITRIYRLTNDPHELVRNEARIAVVKLTGFEGLRFLDVISYPITEWQQISLLHELAQHRRLVFPAIERLLQSSNNSVVEFVLRLVATYQLYDRQPEVLQCLQSPVASVRKNALAALKEIGDDKAAAILTDHFEKEEPTLQVLVLDVIRHIGSADQVPFLIRGLAHPDYAINVAAARALQALHPAAFNLIEQETDTSLAPWNQLLPQLKYETGG